MTVTICGSMRYIPEMLEWYDKLSLESYLVYLPVFLDSHGFRYKQKGKLSMIVVKIPRKTNVGDEIETRLQQLHFQKIEDSDFIFVVNPGGYIGEGTRAEIEFAKKHLGHLPVPIVYLEKPDWDLSPMEGVWRSK